MIGSLTARIFAIFWLTLALVLMLVLMLPKLDSRQMTELLESEQRQGIMISAPEEIAYRHGWITREELLKSADTYGKSPYGEHLHRVADGKIRY